MDPREAFLEWLSTTDHADQEDLYDMFLREPDWHKTVLLHFNHFKAIIEYIDTYLLKYMVEFPGKVGKWVPMDLLHYIHKNDRPYLKRLARFADICKPIGLCVTISDEVIGAMKKGKLGNTFFAQLANFMFHVSEQPELKPAYLPHLQVGGIVREEKEAQMEHTNQQKEQTLLLLEYPQGLQGEAEKTQLSDAGPSQVEDEESLNTIPEVELNNLGTIIIDGVPFVFMHDLEKALGLRMDECLAMICTKAEFPLDNEDGQLGDKLLPLGESVLETVALVSAEVAQDDNALVLESEFLDVQAQLLAGQSSISSDVAGSVDYPQMVEERSSVLLENTAEQDEKQEDVVEMDAWAMREGGKRKAFGPKAALAHYISQLPKNDISIVHKEFSPSGSYGIFALRAMSKVLALSTIGNTVTDIILVNKALATNTFSSGFRGKVLAQIGICQAVGHNEPEEITRCLLHGELPEAKKRKIDLIEKILNTDA